MGLLRRVARARLAGLVIRRLRRAGFTDARYDARAFRVRFTTDGHEAPTILELAPLLATRGGRRRERVDRFVAGLVRSPGLPLDWEQARPLLRPVLRGCTPGTLLRRPVLPFLSEFVVVDSPDTMTYVGPDQPAGWGVSAEEVFEAARANLSGAVLHGVASEPVVVRFVDDGDAYWTSHLLLQHWLERLAGQVGGAPVAFAPERGTLLVTADGSDHLAGLFAQAEEIYAASSRPITPMAYASDENGCTVPYEAPPGHPLHHAAARAERLLAVHEYARQAALTTAHPEAAGAIEAGDAASTTDDATGPADGSPTPAEGTAGTADGTAGTADGTTGTADGTTGTAEGTAGTADGTAGTADGTADGTAGTAEGTTGTAEGTTGTAKDTPSPAHGTAGAADRTPGPTYGPASPGVGRLGGKRGSRKGGSADAEAGLPGLAELRLAGSAELGWRTRAVWERDEPILLPAADEVQAGADICAWAELAAHLRLAPGFEPARWAADSWPRR
ncbi:hypothetical protein [Actinoplanes sp. NPDC026619]|uniref:hypothetical protein n=1 Tax=Actinoplanes sp. NPDC026619 TaxID=3155798 RepID=UPI0033F7606E